MTAGTAGPGPEGGGDSGGAGPDAPPAGGHGQPRGDGTPVPVLEGERAEHWIGDLRRRPRGAPAADVADILGAVREEGDRALLRFSERFDRAPPRRLEVPREWCEEALEVLPDSLRSALERARRNLARVHRSQRRREAPVEVEPGVRAWRVFRPIERIGVYAPGGRAPYPSSLLMAAVPARIAGCGRVVACSPPTADGRPAPAVMAAAAVAGLDALYAVGGAQAVGALAHGTGTVERVDKIVGPGGPWVNEAKLAVHRHVEIDLPAGPSEVAVWADGGADPDLVAAEMLAQAEHGPDSLAVGILPAGPLPGRVAARLADRLAATARRDAAARSLAASALLVHRDPDRAARWVDELAPEHLVLLRDDAEEALADVRHAGSVFLGPETPVAAGDYASGTNHVLPTRFRSRAAGGLSLDDFGKWMQVQRIDAEGLRAIGPAVIELAEWEGFPAHAESVRTRLEGP